MEGLFGPCPVAPPHCMWSKTRGYAKGAVGWCWATLNRRPHCINRLNSVKVVRKFRTSFVQIPHIFNSVHPVPTVLQFLGSVYEACTILLYVSCESTLFAHESCHGGRWSRGMHQPSSLEWTKVQFPLCISSKYHRYRHCGGGRTVIILRLVTVECEEAQATNIGAEYKHKQKIHRRATFFPPFLYFKCKLVRTCIFITLAG